MRRVFFSAGMAAASLLFFASQSFAEEQKAPSQAAATQQVQQETAAAPAPPVPRYIGLKIPLMSPKYADLPVAVVNGEYIRLSDLNSTLEAAHGEMGKAQKAPKIDFAEMVKRIITTRLIIQEARDMGLADLPEVKKLVETYARVTLREHLVEDLAKDTVPGEADVEALYKDVIKEWKVKSVVFEKEEHAKKLEEELAAGKDFDELAAQAVKEGQAVGGEEGKFIKPKDLQEEIQRVIATMKTGSVSPVTKVRSGKKEGYALIKLEDIRYPDDPDAKERAREAVLTAEKVNVVKAGKKALYKKYITINTKLVEKTDFEAKKPGFEKLLKDKRALVTIKGDKPVTIADLAQALKEKFYHGIDRAIEGKQVNKKKIPVLEELVEKKVLRLEAVKRGIDKSERYNNAVKEYENSVIFGTFVQKVVRPDVKVSEDDIAAYYNDNAAEFTYPEMMRLKSLAFGSLKDAEAALDKLKKGAEFNWVKANAEGQLDPKTKGLLTFDGSLLTAKAVGEEVRKVLAGTKADDFRLYQSPEEFFYVLAVVDVVPAQQQPLEEVRSTIAQKVYNSKIKKTLDDWASKLKEAATIETYLVDSGV